MTAAVAGESGNGSGLMRQGTRSPESPVRKRSGGIVSWRKRARSRADRFEAKAVQGMESSSATVGDLGASVGDVAAAHHQWCRILRDRKRLQALGSLLDDHRTRREDRTLHRDGAVPKDQREVERSRSAERGEVEVFDRS